MSTQTSVVLICITGIRNYEKESGRADHLNTCRISPYIHFGQISPRAILTEARHMKSPKFLRKLAWRDMSYWLLTLWPDLPSVPTRVHYRVGDLTHQYIHWKKRQCNIAFTSRNVINFVCKNCMMYICVHILCKYDVIILPQNSFSGVYCFQHVRDNISVIPSTFKVFTL